MIVEKSTQVGIMTKEVRRERGVRVGPVAEKDAVRSVTEVKMKKRGMKGKNMRLGKKGGEKWNIHVGTTIETAPVKGTIILMMVGLEG